MKKIVNKLNNLTLKSKLIISFIGFIVLPTVIVGGLLTKISTGVIENTARKSAIQNNEQVIKNLDTFIGMISKLSEYPISDSDIRKILKKDYTTELNPEYEKKRNFEKVNTFLYEKIKSFSDMIDSTILYYVDTLEICGRSPTDFINIKYSPADEEWFKNIEKADGGAYITGIHRDHQLTPRGEYVVSLGRLIIDPYTKEKLGTIVINVGVDKLEKLWMDTGITKGSRFYLIDAHQNVIFSKNTADISKNIREVLGKSINFSSPHLRPYELEGKPVYIISSSSQISGWTGITLIPENELFSYRQVMFNITIASISIIIILSICIAVFIAKGITGPLSTLNHKIKQVGEGNLDIGMEVTGGEVGEISRTVQKMLDEIKALINKIYKQEEEKRNAEMRALQSQINPHFIYNTIQVIKYMAHLQGVTGIENALTSLTSLLSYTAKSSGDFIPISEELRFIRDYITILNLRYYNKFMVQYKIDDKVYNYKTLKFLLQPIIENAVFHGLEGIEDKGILMIKIEHRDNKIVFEVADNGIGMSNNKLEDILKMDHEKQKSRFNSIGIPNVQQRIKLHFGDEYGLHINSREAQGTTVTITIPAIRVEDAPKT